VAGRDSPVATQTAAALVLLVRLSALGAYLGN